MPNTTKDMTLTRFEVIALLTQRFSHEYDSLIQQYTLSQQLELTEHLLSILALFGEYHPEKQDEIFKNYGEREDALLKKYGKLLKPYKDRQFHRYFNFETVLAEKEVIDSALFNKLPADQQGLSLREIHQFVSVCSNNLYNSRTFLLMQMEPDATLVATQEAVEPDAEMTKARQLLAIYYLLKTCFAIEHRETHTVSAVAHLIHLLTGTKYTNLQNSDIYKKYARMPNYNKGEQLIADLQYIQPYFSRLSMQEAVQLIEEEINRAIKDLPLAARGRYRNK